MNIENKTRSLVLAAVFVAIIVIMRLRLWVHSPGIYERHDHSRSGHNWSHYSWTKIWRILGNGIRTDQSVEKYLHAQSHFLCIFSFY